ncbi:MAG: outer membrane protein assembly factor BamD, partial [Pseudomonadota bacterium]|nr:outer membrane protein assembly factor BamD [Pseudomonadota bacterium]
STEEALVILTQSYDRLGLVELRDDAERVLKTNFPNSTINTDVFGRRKTPWWQIW